MDVGPVSEYTREMMFTVSLSLVILTGFIIEVLVLRGQNRKHVGAVIPVNRMG